MKVFIALALFCFTVPASALNRCGSLFNTSQPNLKSDFRLSEQTTVFHRGEILDVIEVYKPGAVLATARVVLFKDFNGNYKTFRVVQSKDVRLNFDMYRSLHGVEYKLQFYGPKGTYEVHYQRKGSGIHNELVRKVDLEL